jgi:dolichol-phosphate mannosyltransferase
MDGRQGIARFASFSLIIPAYNEAPGIRQALQEADRALAGLVSDYEIVVVDDGSTDGTSAAVAEAARTQNKVRLLRHPGNRGYGAALRTGFETACGELVGFTDADRQFDLADLARLLPLTDRVPVVVGYRIDRQDPWPRRFFSWGYNLLVRVLLGTGVRDCDCALKVFRKEALASLLPQTRGFFVNAEMLTRSRQLGFAVAEVGVRHRPRLAGASKVSLWDIPWTLATLLPFWWSHVLFPVELKAPTSRLTIPKPSSGPGPRSSVLGVLVLIVMAALLFFTRLRCPLLEPQEARYAEIPRQMLAVGHFLVPILHGLPYYDKPPLLYWLVMASYTVFGVHDWAARLVPGSAAFLTVLVTYFWGQRTAGHRAGLAGALVLCLSMRFVYLGRMVTMDVLLCLWVVMALAAAHTATHRSLLGRRAWFLSALACGLGLLTKGPVALVLVMVPVFAYQLLDPRTARPGLWMWLSYLALAVGLACPWFVMLAVWDGSYLEYFFWKHNVLRYVAAFDHEEPAWYYLPGLFLGMLPWSLLLIPLVGFIGRRSPRAAACRPAALGFFLFAALWGLLFFSAAGCKRAGYVLPVMPPLALALGCYLDAALPRAKVQRARAVLFRYRSQLAYQATLLVLALGVGGGLVTALMGLLAPVAAGLLVGLCGAGFAVVHVRGFPRRAAGTWVACGAATFVLLMVAVSQVLPNYARRFSLRGQVRPHAELAQIRRIPVVCYPRRWDSVSYYLRRNDVGVYTSACREHLIADLRSQPETLVFVKSDHSLAELLEALPPSLEFVPRGRRGRVTVGLVRRRMEVPATVLAQREVNASFPRR